MGFKNLFHDMEFLYLMAVIKTALEASLPEAYEMLSELVDGFESARNASIEVTNLFNDMIIAAQNKDIDAVVVLYTEIASKRGGSRESDK
jgi:hypothetical protein